MKSLELEISNFQIVKKDLIDNYEDNLLQCQLQVLNYKNLIENHKKNNVNYVKQIKSLNDKHNKQQVYIQSLLNEINQLKLDENNHLSQRELLQTTISNLKQDVIHNHQKYINLKQSIENDMNYLKLSLNKTNDINGNLIQQKQQKEQQLDSLQQQLDMLQNKLQQLQLSNKELTQENKQCNHEKQRLEKDIGQLQETHQQLQETHQQLHDQHQQVHDQHQQLQHKHQQVIKEYEIKLNENKKKSQLNISFALKQKQIETNDQSIQTDVDVDVDVSVSKEHVRQPAAVEPQPAVKPQPAKVAEQQQQVDKKDIEEAQALSIMTSIDTPRSLSPTLSDEISIPSMSNFPYNTPKQSNELLRLKEQNKQLTVVISQMRQEIESLVNNPNNSNDNDDDNDDDLSDILNKPIQYLQSYCQFLKQHNQLLMKQQLENKDISKEIHQEIQFLRNSIHVKNKENAALILTIANSANSNDKENNNNLLFFQQLLGATNQQIEKKNLKYQQIIEKKSFKISTNY